MRATATAIRGSAAAANHVFIPVFMKPNKLLVFAGQYTYVGSYHQQRLT
jgi:hypothetical protein